MTRKIFLKKCVFFLHFLSRLHIGNFEVFESYIIDMHSRFLKKSGYKLVFRVTRVRFAKNGKTVSSGKSPWKNLRFHKIDSGFWFSFTICMLTQITRSQILKFHINSMSKKMVLSHEMHEFTLTNNFDTSKSIFH